MMNTKTLVNPYSVPGFRKFLISKSNLLNLVLIASGGWGRKIPGYPIRFRHVVSQFDLKSKSSWDVPKYK